MEFVFSLFGAIAAVAAVAGVAISWRARRAEARRVERGLRRRLYEELGELHEPLLRHRARDAGLSDSEVETIVRYVSDCRGVAALTRAVACGMTAEELARCEELESKAERILLG